MRPRAALQTLRFLVVPVALLALAVPGAPASVQQDLVGISPLGCTIDIYLNAPSDTQTYALYGAASTLDMYVPAAFQYPGPFGRDVGQPDPFLLSSTPDLDKDSFLTIGDLDDKMISSVGIDFGTWSSDAALVVDDGAVFILDPDRSPRGRVRLARVTLESSSPMRFSVQGQHYEKTGEHSDRLRQSYAIHLQCTPAH